MQNTGLLTGWQCANHFLQLQRDQRRSCFGTIATFVGVIADSARMVVEEQRTQSTSGTVYLYDCGEYHCLLPVAIVFGVLHGHTIPCLVRQVATDQNFRGKNHMAKYKPQHARLLFIDRKIREQQYPNCSSLAAEWETSIKTIQRDLDYMRYELDAPLQYSAKHRGFCYTEEQYQLPAINIKESDLFAIYLADKLLGQYAGTPVYDSLRSVFSKIEDSLPDKVSVRPGGQALFTVFPPFATVIQPEVLTTVFDCLRTSTRLAIEYRNPGGEPIWRQIDPYHGVRFEGDWYVVGYCHLRQEIRTFSLARIIRAKKVKERFSVPHQFDFKKLSGSHFGVHWGGQETEVRILFTREAAPYVRERQWHPSQGMEEMADGSLVLSLTVNHLLELKRWILSWGASARVLSPDTLLNELRKSTQDLAAMYSNTESNTSARH